MAPCFILNAGGSFVRMNPKTGDVLATATRGLLENEDLDGVMSPDGTRMVVNGPGRRVRLLEVDKQEYVGTDSKTWGSSPTFAPDGSQFARSGRTVPALGRPHRGVPSQPAPAEPDSDLFHRLSAGQHRPAHRLHRRQDLDRGHANEHVGRPRVRDCREKPLRRGVGAVLFPISPTSRPAPVAGRNLIPDM